MTLERLAEALEARKCGTGFRCRCPLHGGGPDVFSIAQKSGKLLVFCFGGCRQADVLRELENRNLWSAERATIWERLYRAVDELDRAQRKRMADNASGAYDVLKLRALERGYWAAWERWCRRQFESARMLRQTP